MGTYGQTALKTAHPKGKARTHKTGTNLVRASTLSRSSITGRVAGFLITEVPASVFPLTEMTP